MLYLLQQFWVFCLIAVLLGVVVSWLTRGEKVGSSFWFNLLLIAGAVGLVVALLFWFRGRGGLGLEIALLLLASYLIGCCIPCLLGCCGEKSAEAKPAGLMAPRGGKADDLTRLSFIDKNREAKLNGLGFYHYDQICALKGNDRVWLWNVAGLNSVAGAGSKADDWAGWQEACQGGKDTNPVQSPVVVAEPTKPVQVVSEMAKVEGEDDITGNRPLGLKAARNNKADDLKRIRGIGPQNEGRLHGLGIWHFDQIANWTHDNVLWIGSYLAFPGRIDREDWLGQAKVLAAGGMTEFAKRVDKGEVPTSLDDGSHGQNNVEKVKLQ